MNPGWFGVEALGTEKAGLQQTDQQPLGCLTGELGENSPNSPVVFCCIISPDLLQNDTVSIGSKRSHQALRSFGYQVDVIYCERNDLRRNQSIDELVCTIRMVRKKAPSALVSTFWGLGRLSYKSH